MSINFAGRNCVGQLSIEFRRTVEPDRMHDQLMYGKNVGILVSGFGQQAQFCIVRNNFPDENWRIADLGPILLLSFILGRNLYDQPPQFDLVNLPGLSNQSEDTGFGGELADRNHRRNISAPFMTKTKSGPLNSHPWKHVDVKILEFHVGMKFLAEHLLDIPLKVRIGEVNTGYDDGHNNDGH